MLNVTALFPVACHNIAWRKSRREFRLSPPCNWDSRVFETLAARYRRFWTAYQFHRQGQHTLLNIPEDRRLDLQTSVHQHHVLCSTCACFCSSVPSWSSHEYYYYYYYYYLARSVLTVLPVALWPFCDLLCLAQFIICPPVIKSDRYPQIQAVFQCIIAKKRAEASHSDNISIRILKI